MELLNQRVGVISDLLDMLKEHLNSSHGEQLEWIVIILIAFEIIIGVITISIDLTSYYQDKDKPYGYSYWNHFFIRWTCSKPILWIGCVAFKRLFSSSAIKGINSNSFSSLKV